MNHAKMAAGGHKEGKKEGKPETVRRPEEEEEEDEKEEEEEEKGLLGDFVRALHPQEMHMSQEI